MEKKKTSRGELAPHYDMNIPDSNKIFSYVAPGMFASSIKCDYYLCEFLVIA